LACRNEISESKRSPHLFMQLLGVSGKFQRDCSVSRYPLLINPSHFLTVPLPKSELTSVVVSIRQSVCQTEIKQNTNLSSAQTCQISGMWYISNKMRPWVLYTNKCT